MSNLPPTLPSMTASLLFHPVLILIVLGLLSTTTCAFTSKSSIYRLVSFVICSAVAWRTILTFDNYVQSTGWAARILAGSVFSIPLSLLDRLILRNWAYESDYVGPVEHSELERQKQTRWEWGSIVSGSQLYIGTEKEVANANRFSVDDPGYLPSKTAFLLRRIVVIIACFFVHNLAVQVQLHADSQLLSDAYVPFFGRMRLVSANDIITRFQITFSFWLSQYCLLQLFFSIAALLGTVFAEPSEVRFWPPFFGSIQTSYTVRNFWRCIALSTDKFWHQGLQLNLKGPAEFMANTVLQLTPHTVLSRYTKIFFAFFVSGALHVYSDCGGGLSMAESGAFRFFCSQTLGIMVEDAVQDIYKQIFGDKGKLFRKVVGYVWVASFLAWSTPTWIYPVTRTGRREDLLMSFGAFRTILPTFSVT